MGKEDARILLVEMFDSAIAAADPLKVVAEALPARASGRTLIIGAGKASARMAEAVEQAWGPCEGLIITRDGYERPLKGITLRSASHPVPDQRGMDATREMLDFVTPLTEDDLVIALISGGGSSLLVQPAGRLTLQNKQAVNQALLASGAPISDMNLVRRHLSAIKGGKLAAAAFPARCHTLAISDVAGDSPLAIASGPTVGDNSTPAQALEVLRKWKVAVPPAVISHLKEHDLVFTPDSPELARSTYFIVAAPSQSLSAAAEIAGSRGLNVLNLGDAIEGEARTVARDHAKRIRAMRQSVGNSATPTLVLSGGECSVTRTGSGVGGPNAEFLLALAIELDGMRNVFALAGDTDGVDGGAEVAASLIAPDTLERAEALGISPQAALDNNDAHGFFERLGDQIITGPTLTNVNDFRAILIDYV